MSVLPILVGGGLGAYSVALSFFEAFGVHAHVVHPRTDRLCRRAAFLHAHPVASLGAQAVREVCRLCEGRGRDTALVVPCDETAAACLLHERADLPSDASLLLPDASVGALLCDRAQTLACLNRLGIPTIPHIVFSSVGELARQQAAGAVTFPAVLASAERTSLVRASCVASRADAFAAASAIFGAGCRDALLLRSVLTGRSPLQKTLVTVHDRTCRVTGAVLARSVTPTDPAAPRYTALLAEAQDAFSSRLCRAAEQLGCRGVIQYDIVYDANGRPFVWDLHLSAGEHVDVLRACGISLARTLVEQARGEQTTACMRYPAVYWHTASARIVRRTGIPREAKEAMARQATGFAFEPTVSMSCRLVHHRVWHIPFFR